jgi:hypothetical protein
LIGKRLRLESLFLSSDHQVVPKTLPYLYFWHETVRSTAFPASETEDVIRRYRRKNSASH